MRFFSLPTAIPQLNDDCLLVIFHHLPLKDLCNVAESCTRFQSVARQAFASRAECKLYPMRINVKYSCRLMPQYQHMRFLANFGDIIEELELSNHHGIGNIKDTVDAFNMVERYCGNTLKGLTISLPGDRLPKNLPKVAINLMKKVKKLNLHLGKYDTLFMRVELHKCQQLVHLGVQRCSDMLFHAHHYFPHLRSLKHRICLNPVVIDNVLYFFKRHSALTRLVITIEDSRVAPLHFLALLSKLESLDIKFVGCHITIAEPLRELKVLKELTLHGNPEQYKGIQCSDSQLNAEILKNLGSIGTLQKLELNHVFDLGPMVEFISRFSALRALHITVGVLHITPLESLNNSNLAELHITSGEINYEMDFPDIFNNLKQLKLIKFNCFDTVLFDKDMCDKLVDICISQGRQLKIGVNNYVMKDWRQHFNYKHLENSKLKKHIRVFQMEENPFWNCECGSCPPRLSSRGCPLQCEDDCMYIRPMIYD